jgi:hypothetical protein
VLSAYVTAGRIDTAFELLLRHHNSGTRHDDDATMLRAIIMGAARARSQDDVETAILQV